VPARALLIALIAVELLAFYLLLHGGGWVYDDNLSLELAHQGGLHWHWLSFSLFDHFEIAHRVVFSLQALLMPLDYRWALVTMLGLLGLAIYLFERCTRMLLGDGWAPLVAAGYFGISVLLVSQLQWWSAGLEGLPTLACDLACLWAYLAYQAERSHRAIAISAGAMAVGLLFYEKPVYMPFYLILLRVLLLSPRLAPRALAAAIWRERDIWAAYAAVIVGYLVLRKVAGAPSDPVHGSASLSTWTTFIRVLWAQTLVPAAFGLTVPASGLSHVQVLGVAALEVVVGLGLVGSLLRKPSAWRAWVALATCVLATIVLVGMERLAQFGPATGSNPRYLLDFTWLVPLLAGLAFSRQRIFAPHAVDSHVPLPPFPRVPVVLAATALIGAYAATSIATAARLQDTWPGHAAREWEQHVQTGLSKLARPGEDAVIANADVPWYILQGNFAPYNRLSQLLPRYGGRTQVDGPLGRPLYAVDDLGRLRRAGVGSIVDAFPIHARGCAGSRGVRLQRTIRPPASPGAYYLILAYASPRSQSLPLSVDQGSGVQAMRTPVALAAGAHRSIAWLGDAPHGIVIDLPAGGHVCLRRLEVVTLKVLG